MLSITRHSQELVHTTLSITHLQQLQNNVGCLVPDLSYFKLRQLETGEGTVIETTERLCGAHQDVVMYIYI
jgi:hypothetical protein